MYISTQKKGKKPMSEAKKKIHVTATCKSAQEALQLAEKHRKFPGVMQVKTEGNILTFICEVVARAALIVYGKLKDALPYYCSCSCRPITE